MKFLKIVLTLLILAAALYGFYAYQSSPFGTGGDIYINKGMSVSQVGEMLQKEGVLRNRWFFKILARISPHPIVLKPGEYEFAAQLTPQEVLSKIQRGERVVHKLVIPEGYTFAQIAQAIEKAGIAPAAEVHRYYRDPAWLQKLGFPAVSLEGYLFPATYEYDRGTHLEDLLQQILKTFQRQYDPALRERSQAIGWTIPQVVTLASIIEKETGRSQERPLISSVFQNRLRLGMLLQSDPTVIFGLPNFNGNIHREDLKNPHPYNTYVHPGLPPGPIASPGKSSLQAVLQPATSSYLYFVGKGDGTHYFSSTLEEHEAAVSKYQLKQNPESLPAAAPLPSPKPLM